MSFFVNQGIVSLLLLYDRDSSENFDDDTSVDEVTFDRDNDETASNCSSGREDDADEEFDQNDDSEPSSSSDDGDKPELLYPFQTHEIGPVMTKCRSTINEREVEFIV